MIFAAGELLRGDMKNLDDKQRVMAYGLETSEAFFAPHGIAVQSVITERASGHDTRKPRGPGFVCCLRISSPTPHRHWRPAHQLRISQVTTAST